MSGEESGDAIAAPSAGARAAIALSSTIATAIAMVAAVLVLFLLAMRGVSLSTPLGAAASGAFVGGLLLAGPLAATWMVRKAVGVDTVCPPRVATASLIGVSAAWVLTARLYLALPPIGIGACLLLGSAGGALLGTFGRHSPRTTAFWAMGALVSMAGSAVLGVMAIPRNAPIPEVPTEAPMRAAPKSSWTWRPPYEAGDVVGMPGDGPPLVASRGSVFAVSAAGKTSWEFTSGDIYSSFGSGAVGADGRIYLRYRSKVYCLGLDGRKQFEVPVPAEGIAVAPDGTLRLGTRKSLLAMEANGRVLWEVSTDANYYGGVLSVGADGTTYTAGRVLMAIGPDGRVRWTVAETDYYTSPAVDANGALYYVGQKGILSLDAAGGKRWSLPTGNPCSADPHTPVVSSDGTVYMAGCGLWALGPEGRVKWRRSPGLREKNYFAVSPVLGDDGTIFVADAWAAKIMAYTPDGRLCWVLSPAFPPRPDGSALVTFLALSDTGALYATIWGDLVAIPSGVRGLMKSPWPDPHHHPSRGWPTSAANR